MSNAIARARTVKGALRVDIKTPCAVQYGRLPLAITAASPQYSTTMARPSRASYRHTRRNSSQRRVSPMTPDAQTSSLRRRNLYCPPMSVTTRQLQIRSWREELHDLTENLTQVQERIQQLETIQPEYSWDEDDNDAELAPYRTIPPRSSSIPYRLPELGFSPAQDSFQLPIDDWLKASPPELPTSADVPPPLAVENVGKQSASPARPISTALNESPGARRQSHQREQSAATTASFDSYSTEAVQVYEASTAAVARPFVRSIASIRAARSVMPSRDDPRQVLAMQPSSNNKENRPPTPGLFPAPLFTGRKTRRRPRRISSLSRPSSDPVVGQDFESSQHSVSSASLAPGVTDLSHVRQKPPSETTVIQRRAFPPSSAVSSKHMTENDSSDGAPCFTSSEAGSPRPSTFETYRRGESSTPMSFRSPPWLHSSPPPSDVPHLDSTSLSISEPATPTPAGTRSCPRLKLFPKIHQTSSESLGQECQTKHAYDPFYSMCQDQSGYVEPTPTPVPDNAQGIAIADPYLYPDSPQQETASENIDRRKRVADPHRGLVRSPRRKLRSFLRKLTPTTNKTRYSMPPRFVPETQALVRLDDPIATPPRLPTRRGSTLPFDQALLGELTKISDRQASPAKAAPSPARRIRNSMHDAAGMSLGRTAAATHAHWRAQRSRSSILFPAPLRSRAPTGSTFNTSFSSGPSFHFLPKVDQVGMPSDRRGPAMRRQRKSRY